MVPSFAGRTALSRWPQPTLWWWVSSHSHTHRESGTTTTAKILVYNSHTLTQKPLKSPHPYLRGVRTQAEHRARGALHYKIFHSGSKYFQDYSVNAMCTPYSTLKMAPVMFLVLWARWSPLYISKQPPWKVQQKPQLVWDFPEVATISEVLGKLL